MGYSENSENSENSEHSDYSEKLRTLMNTRNHICRTLALLLLCLPASIAAQMEKNTMFKVAVGELQYTPKQKKATVGNVIGTISKAVVLGKVTQQQDKYADAVRASVLSGFGKVKRFRTTDGMYGEGEIQPGALALYADGTINNISTTTELFTPSSKDLLPYDVYKAQIEVVVHVKDAHDDHIVDTHTFYVTDYDLGWVKSEHDALNNAFVLLTSRVAKHYNKLFPLNASIIEAGDAKKDKQKELYIDLGEEFGAYEGMKLTVYSVKTIAGRYANKELGTIKITQVMGQDVSLCKVQSGGKNIKAALDEGETVVAVSTN